MFIFNLLIMVSIMENVHCSTLREKSETVFFPGENQTHPCGGKVAYTLFVVTATIVLFVLMIYITKKRFAKEHDQAKSYAYNKKPKKSKQKHIIASMNQRKPQIYSVTIQQSVDAKKYDIQNSV